MAGERRRARGEAEPGNVSGRKVREAPRHQRIRRPDERGNQRENISDGFAVSRGLGSRNDQHRRAEESEERGERVPQARSNARDNERRQYDDEQRPKIVDEVGLDRRSISQREEEEEMKAEEAIDAERERRGRWRPAHERSASHQSADGECKSGEKERRNRR